MVVNHTILCVDDEQHNLDALKRALRKEYSVVTALSGSEGLSLLDDNDVSLIITDQRMPGMTGVEFLENTIDRHPDIVRIILTGFTDVEDLIGAINTGRVYRYITKPWDPNDLKVTVKRALESLELTLENRKLLDDVIRLEKLATVGQVAGGIAHEVRNQLTVLMGIQLIERQFPDNQLVNSIAERMLRARDRIVNILDEIKGYAKQQEQELKKERVDVPRLLDEVIQIVSFDPDVKQVEFEVRAENCPALECDRSRIIQVLINLIRNAAHAMDGRGTVVVTAEKPDRDIFIRVRDSGCGIPEENIEKIWEPFFTTKGDNGTGLGLQISKRILQAHAGDLQCESEVGKGTTFTLSFPG